MFVVYSSREQWKWRRETWAANVWEPGDNEEPGVLASTTPPRRRGRQQRGGKGKDGKGRMRKAWRKEGRESGCERKYGIA